MDKICDQEGNVLDMNGKISSDSTIIHFQKAPKVLKQIKSGIQKLYSLAFKLESDVNKEELFERAKNRMEEAKASVMIAIHHILYIRAEQCTTHWTRRRAVM